MLNLLPEETQLLVLVQLDAMSLGALAQTCRVYGTARKNEHNGLAGAAAAMRIGSRGFQPCGHPISDLKSIEKPLPVIAAGGESTFVCCPDAGSLCYCGSDQLQPETSCLRSLDSLPTPVTAVAVGSEHVAVLAAGLLHTGGAGFRGRLGHGDEDRRDVPTKVEMKSPLGASRIRLLAAGASMTAIVTIDGQLWTCGSGHSGALGHGRKQMQSTLTAGTATV